MFKCLQIMCVKYYELRYVIAPRQRWCICDTASKFASFSVFGLKDEKLIIKQTYTKIEAYKLYCKVFWIFLPNIIKINPYNIELYRFKVGAFFETQCSVSISSRVCD